MTLARIKTHFASWRDWEMNPIVVRELRQAVRSWTITAMLMLLLLALLIASLLALLNNSVDINANEQLGAGLFHGFLVIIAVAGILFIPPYLGARVAAEREANNPDLLYISTLSPGRIILGKFLCGAYVTFLFFSVCLPFLALTNLLRGVDLPTIFFLMALLYMVACVVNLAAIFIACLPVTRLARVILGFLGFVFLVYAFFAMLTASFELMRSGMGGMVFQRGFATACLAIILVCLAVGGLLYILAVALISPPSANRAPVPRLYLTGLLLGGGALAFYGSLQGGRVEMFYFWFYPVNVLLVISLLVCVSNHDQLSWRVRRKIPPAGLKRGLAFCFYNGAAGGLAWVAALAVLNFLETMFFSLGWASGPLPPASPAPLSPDFLGSLAGYYPSMMMYFFAYALLGVRLHRRFFSHTAPKIAAILAVLLTALTALLPTLALFFMNQLSWRSAEHFQPGNAFNLIGGPETHSYLTPHLWCSAGMLLAALALNARWFVTQWRNFQPPAANLPAKSD